GVSLEGEEFLAGLGIPHLDLPRSAARRPSTSSAPRSERPTRAGQAFAIRAEGPADAAHALESKQLPAGLGVPYLTNEEQTFAFRDEGPGPAGSLDGEEFLAGLGIPLLYFTAEAFPHLLELFILTLREDFR